MVADDFIQCIFPLKNPVDLRKQNINIVGFADIVVRADLQPL